MLPLPSNREEFRFGNIVAEPLRARPPSFEERLSSAEHGSRQLSWRTCGLTRRTKNHGTSLGEASGAFRRNTVYHVTSSTKSDRGSEPVCCVQMHRLGKNK